MSIEFVMDNKVECECSEKALGPDDNAYGKNTKQSKMEIASGVN